MSVHGITVVFFPLVGDISCPTKLLTAFILLVIYMIDTHATERDPDKTRR